MTGRLWRNALATLADPDVQIDIGVTGLAVSGLAVR